TLLLISHDRDFLDRLVTGIIAFEGGGRLREYAGGHSDMLHQRAPAAADQTRTRGVDEPKARAAPRRASSRGHRDLDRLLGQIDALSAEIDRLEGDLADPDLFSRDRRAFEALSERLTRSRDERAAAEQRWLELALRLERITD
ncbi:MAG: ABC transporter ATP-binding protein, partial [Geminicoccales bacterium]